MPHHTLSVIIPTKNRPLLLTRALASVVIQDYLSFEICIVDNNTDENLNTEIKTTISRFELDYPALQWRYIRSYKPFASGARNDGIAAVTGDYIIFLDDDDEMLSGSIKTRMHEMLSDPELALLYCAGYSKIYTYPFSMYRYYHYSKILHKDKLMMMSCSSIMINKDAFTGNNLFFDENLSRMEDYDWCKMVIKLGLKVKSIPQPLVQINLHPETRLSSQKIVNYNFKNILIKKWGAPEEDVVYHYAEGVYLWRKCFGIEKKRLSEISQKLQDDFNRRPSLFFRLKFALLSISPLLFLAIYHTALILRQSYKNAVAHSRK